MVHRCPRFHALGPNPFASTTRSFFHLSGSSQSHYSECERCRDKKTETRNYCSSKIACNLTFSGIVLRSACVRRLVMEHLLLWRKQRPKKPLSVERFVVSTTLPVDLRRSDLRTHRITPYSILVLRSSSKSAPHTTVFNSYCKGITPAHS